MKKSPLPPPPETPQGVALIEDLIANLQYTGWLDPAERAEPSPLPAQVLTDLGFPSGKRLSPSLKRWLAFDARWLTRFGWFDAEGHLTPRRLDAIVTAEFGHFGQFYQDVAALTGECFLLGEDVGDTRRILAVTQPDSLGEYPVLVIDVDDGAEIEVGYPGFDVYLADFLDVEAVPACDWERYPTLFRDPRYAGRMRQHAKHLFGGRQGFKLV